MHRRAAILVAAFVLCLPAVGTSSPLGVDLDVDLLEFGPEFGLEPLVSAYPPSFTDILRNGVYPDDIFSGEVDFETGRLQSLQTDDLETVYYYGPGHLTLHTWVFDPVTGIPVDAQFNAELDPMTVSVCEESTGCSGPPLGSTGSGGGVFLGRGVFDPILAKALHVGPYSDGGFLDYFYMDIITGDPSSRVRLAGTDGTHLTISAVVPEAPPFALWLVVMLAVLVSARRMTAAGMRPSQRSCR